MPSGKGGKMRAVHVQFSMIVGMVVLAIAGAITGQEGLYFVAAGMGVLFFFGML